MNKQITRITVIAFMIALEVVLTRLLSINTPMIRISLGFIPVVVVAILYGPIFSMISYAIGDVIGAILFPTGAFFPGFTISAALTGLIFGYFFYGKEIRLKNLLPATILVAVVVNLLLNNLWLYMLMGGKLWAILLSRVIKEIVICIIQIILIPIIARIIEPYKKKLGL